MGGKKKTKWRKVSLAEFSKENPGTEKLTNEDSKTGALKNRDTENCANQSYESFPENLANDCQSDYVEYVDGTYYSTPYLFYRPMEVPIYTNYVFPPDVCCYYYPQTEYQQLPEYTPLPPQDFIPDNDTVYLLLPASALQQAPHNDLPHINYHWRNKPRRRYHDYYAGPQDKDYYQSYKDTDKRRTGPNTNQFKYSHQNYHSKRMSQRRYSIEDNNAYIPDGNEANPNLSDRFGNKSNFSSNNINHTSIDKTGSQPLKTKEVCHTHNNENKLYNSINPVNNKCEQYPNNKILHKDNYTEINDNIQTDHSILQYKAQNIKGQAELNHGIELQNESSKSYDRNVMENVSITDEMTTETDSESINSLRSLNLIDESIDFNKCIDETDNEKTSFNLEMRNNNVRSPNLQSSMPDIISTINNIQPFKVQSSSSFPQVHQQRAKNKSGDNKTPANDPNSPLNSICQLSNSEAVNREIDEELRQLTEKSLKANQSIYKLAYDESITDQSESNSRSPSPVDPLFQVPKSLTNDEILIHEADSGSDAGSEDIELIPHRYESETFLNESKHVYVNRLSLAVELLRTHENLPYDEEFKRVAWSENDKETKKSNCDNCNEINSNPSNDLFSTSKENDDKMAELRNSIELTPAGDNLKNFSCEAAAEVKEESTREQDNSESVRAGYQRFGIQFHHYLSPRSSLISPCPCCIMM